jgi:hypothetical protein
VEMLGVWAHEHQVHLVISLVGILISRVVSF